MCIAIIGGGVSGLVSAYLLNEDHDIVPFEATGYIGGHTSEEDRCELLSGPESAGLRRPTLLRNS